jgi:CubicO group peptidase (beta-lactamase class C family)
VVVSAARGDEHEVLTRGLWAAGSVPSEHTVFYAASLTKQLIGVLTALSSDAGELRTDASVRHWLPELPGWTEAVTVADLIHHTAGLPRELPAPGGARSTSSVIAAVGKLTEPDAPPGTRFEYSNDGYVLLAAILERASGISADRLAAERVFTPLGMSDSALTTRPIRTVPGEPDPPATIGDGGWWTTVADTGLLLQYLNRQAIGSRLMETAWLVSGQHVNYAWGVRVTRIGGLAAASHGGSWARWQSKTLRIPERDCTVVVAAQSDNAQAVSDLGTDLAAQLSSAR